MTTLSRRACRPRLATTLRGNERRERHMPIHSRLGAMSCDFNVWREGRGAVFAGPFALDVETTAIDDEDPSRVPSFVIGAACDGSSGFFIPAGRCAAFLAAHDG